VGQGAGQDGRQDGRVSELRQQDGVVLPQACLQRLPLLYFQSVHVATPYLLGQGGADFVQLLWRCRLACIQPVLEILKRFQQMFRLAASQRSTERQQFGADIEHLLDLLDFFQLDTGARRDR